MSKDRPALIEEIKNNPVKLDKLAKELVQDGPTDDWRGS
jgi:hypothetical protein